MGDLLLAILLTVRETAGVARASEVVRSGIPLPRALDVRTLERLAIVDDAKRGVPAQFEVLARWNAARDDESAPIQWLLATFPATVAANGSAKYTLLTDSGTAGFGTDLRVTQRGTRFTIDAGGATFILEPQSLFEEIRGGAATLARGGSLTLRANGGDAVYATTRRAFIEHQSALSATIVIDGVYGNGLTSTRRYTFAAGTPIAIVRQTLAWEQTRCAAGEIACNGAPNGVRVGRIRDTLRGAVTARAAITIRGARSDAPMEGGIAIGQTASIAQLLRANRRAPPRFEIAMPSAMASGAKAGGAALAIGDLAVAFDHMHRYEPQALRILEDGSLAIDVASDEVWLGARQALYATFAIGIASPERVWAAVNHPLRAWPSAAAFASSGATGDLPLGALPPDLADYDRAVAQALDNTLRATDSVGIYGLMSYGLFPRHWGERDLRR